MNENIGALPTKKLKKAMEVNTIPKEMESLEMPDFEKLEEIVEKKIYTTSGVDTKPKEKPSIGEVSKEKSKEIKDANAVDSKGNYYKVLKKQIKK